MQPVFPFPIKLAAVSWALTCAGMVAAIVSRLVGNNAPPPAAASPPPLTLAVRTIPIIPELAFDQRWQVPPPVIAATPPLAAATRPEPATKPVNAADSKPERHASRRAEPRDRVCADRGRRYFHIGRHLSWRCRHGST
jgi:hypothetical protein